MGMHVRHIDKYNVMYYLKDGSITSAIREIKLNELFHSELLVMDTWTSRFYHDLNQKERDIRKNLEEKYRFDSGCSFINDDDYKNLKSLSETLISLINNPLWIDIFIVGEKLKVDIKPDEMGMFEPIRQKCIDAIIKHFDQY